MKGVCTVTRSMLRILCVGLLSTDHFDVFPTPMSLFLSFILTPILSTFMDQERKNPFHLLGFYDEPDT